VRLVSHKIASGSVTVFVNDVPWQEVTTFYESRWDSLHFTLETDGNDVSTIVFGDGISGRKPVAGDRIKVEYLETLGASGNIGARLITELSTPVYYDGQLVTVLVTNPRAATGGAEAETIEHARGQTPLELRTLWKAVTRDDYQTLVEGYPGVAKAQILDTNDCLNIRYYTINIAVAPTGAGYMSALLKQQLADFLESRKVVTVNVNLFDPSYRSINIDAEVYAYTGEDLDAVRNRAQAALADFFHFDRITFGQTIYQSDLVALLDGTRGVSHVHVYAPAADVILRRGELPVLGDVNLDVRRAAN
jgi:predicted phage baseplate assembly protein